MTTIWTVLPTTQKNQLLGYQQQQTELMKNFATVVSEAVSTSIANTMRTELVPIFDEMKSTVKEFSEIASQQQKDGLNQVVQEFIRCMNESLRGQFDELAANDSKKPVNGRKHLLSRCKKLWMAFAIHRMKLKRSMPFLIRPLKK